MVKSEAIQTRHIIADLRLNSLKIRPQNGLFYVKLQPVDDDRENIVPSGHRTNQPIIYSYISISA